jgi:hypothetical protein
VTCSTDFGLDPNLTFISFLNYKFDRKIEKQENWLTKRIEGLDKKKVDQLPESRCCGDVYWSPHDEFPLYMIGLMFDIIGHSCKLKTWKLLKNSRKAQILGNHQLTIRKSLVGVDSDKIDPLPNFLYIFSWKYI